MTPIDPESSVGVGQSASSPPNQNRNQSEDPDGLDSLKKTIGLLSPFAAVRDNDAVMSETKRMYGTKADDPRFIRARPVERKKANMSSILGFQGDVQISSCARSTHVCDGSFEDVLREKHDDGGKLYFRRKNDFSEYAEAKARNPQLS